ncbi:MULTISPECIES: hypothetical protein [Exiguobacterium]|uniref:hypothetical protein n=1 Tax=Exiguobacterium TaxID=33986 RepID=UPI000DF744AC|nr:MULTISPECIES: hypothetical protein [Exiguobacterium]MCK2157559.1 hypothetical protein [Exiguobacterium sp. 17-1]MDW2887086.1 hypothetical protein [Exiguobacterium sibiricum]RDB34370.1 hypothetical protein DVG79_06750 [Exiguobacterium sp. RIT594]HCN59296.1 hypothetical protein [Exiguobacterium sp.]
MWKNPSYRYGIWSLIVSFFLFLIVQMYSAYIELSPKFDGEALEEYHLIYFPVIALIVGCTFLIGGWWNEDFKQEAQKRAALEAEKSAE